MIVGTEIFSRLSLRINEFENTILDFCKLTAKYKLLGFDLAECYGDAKLQKVFGDLQNRFNFEIDTKFGHEIIEGVKHPKFNITNVSKQVKTSAIFIPNIRTLYFHSGENAEFFNENLWNMLNQDLKSNKIRHLGLSIQNRLLEENSLEQIVSASKFNIDVLQIPLNLTHKIALNRAIPLARDNGMFIVSRLIFAKGSLIKLDLDQLINLCSLNLSLSKLKSDLITMLEISTDKKDTNTYLKIALIFLWTLQHTDAFVLASRNLDQFFANIKILQMITENQYINQ